MLTIAEAFEKLLSTVVPREITHTALEKSLGLVLCEDVHSTADSPPFDKSSMDGYAVRSVDLVPGLSDDAGATKVTSGLATRSMPNVTLRVIETIVAGRVPEKTIGPGDAAQIMTGAPLPAGADTVIKVEDTRREGDHVVLSSGPVAKATNVINRGSSVRAGDCVLRAGTFLNGSRIGALAELGRSKVAIRQRPTVSVLATGDELVSISETPGPGQIRNSNESMLSAQIEAAGGLVRRLGIARDRREDLRFHIDQGLQSDILVLAGGVSAGILDLVPQVLTEAGVQEVFHKVALKPGKPVWFGVRTRPNRSNCYVFGLPGNPVSSLVCCELFVRTAIRRLMGVEPALPEGNYARLEHDFSNRSDRPTYHPARLSQSAEGWSVTLVPWHGSSDLCGTVQANGMAFVPAEQRQWRAGDRLETFVW